MAAHHGIDVLQMILGGLLFWFPGFAWTWAMAPRIPFAYRVPLSIVAAFTILPAAMMTLHFLLAVPITVQTSAMLAAAIGVPGAVFAFRQGAARGASRASTAPSTSRP